MAEHPSARIVRMHVWGRTTAKPPRRKTRLIPLSTLKNVRTAPEVRLHLDCQKTVLHQLLLM